MVILLAAVANVFTAKARAVMALAKVLGVARGGLVGAGSLGIVVVVSVDNLLGGSYIWPLKDLAPCHNGWKDTRCVGVNINGKDVGFDGCDVEELKEIHGVGLNDGTELVLGLVVAWVKVGKARIDVIV